MSNDQVGEEALKTDEPDFNPPCDKHQVWDGQRSRVGGHLEDLFLQFRGEDRVGGSTGHLEGWSEDGFVRVKATNHKTGD